jgi:hypothetical protein
MFLNQIGDISAPLAPVINANTKEVRHMTAVRMMVYHSGAARIYVKLRLHNSRGNALFCVDGNLLFTAIEKHMGCCISGMWKALIPVVWTNPTMGPKRMLEQTSVTSS